MFNATFKRTAVAAAIAMGLSGAAMAQETSSSLRGVVTTESGQVGVLPRFYGRFKTFVNFLS